MSDSSSDDDSSPVSIANPYNTELDRRIEEANRAFPLPLAPPSIRANANPSVRQPSISIVSTDIPRRVNRRINYYDPDEMEYLFRLFSNESVSYLKRGRVRNIFEYLINSELDGFITAEEIEKYRNMGNEWIGLGDNRLDSAIRTAQAKMQGVLERMAPPPPPSPRHLPETRPRVLNKEFFDVILRDDVSVANFLNNNTYPDNKPFIVSHNREFAGNYVLPQKEIFYECAPGATQDMPYKSRDSKTFVKLIGAGGATILCIRPRWFDNPTHTPIIVRAVKEGEVAQIISKTCQDRPQGLRRLIGADHCNLEAPLDYYKLVPYKQKSIRKGRTKRARGSPNTRRVRNEARSAFQAEKARKKRENAQDNMLKNMTNTPSLSSSPSPVPMVNNFFPSS